MNSPCAHRLTERHWDLLTLVLLQPAFGAQPAQAVPAFGAQSSSAFGAQSTPAFGAGFGGGGAFGGAGAFGAKPAFGASSSPAFGAASSPAFGQSPGGFGAAAPAFGQGGGGELCICSSMQKQSQYCAQPEAPSREQKHANFASGS